MGIGDRLIALGKSLRIQHRNSHRKYTYAKLAASPINRIDPNMAAYQLRMMSSRALVSAK